MKFREEINEEGIVIKSSGGKAEVMLANQENCDACSAKLFCKPSSGKEKILIVNDKFNSRIGDKVIIAIKGNDLLHVSFLLYGIPLLILISGIVIGLEVFNDMSNKEFYAFVLSLIPTTIYLFVLKNILSKKKRGLEPEIISR